MAVHHDFTGTTCFPRPCFLSLFYALLPWAGWLLPLLICVTESRTKKKHCLGFRAHLWPDSAPRPVPASEPLAPSVGRSPRLPDDSVLMFGATLYPGNSSGNESPFALDY